MDEYVVIFRSHSSFLLYRKDRDKELQVVFTLYRIGLIGKKNVNIIYEKNNYEYKFISLTICS